MKIGVVCTGISSGGLVSVLKDFVNYGSFEGDIVLFCDRAFLEKYDVNQNKLKIVCSDYLSYGKIGNLFKRRYKREFIQLVDSYNIDALFFITGLYKKGLEKYKRYVVLNNQLYFDFKTLFEQENIKVSLYTLLNAINFRKGLSKMDGVFFSSLYSYNHAKPFIRNNNASVVPFACNSIFMQAEPNNCQKKCNDALKIVNIGSIIPYKNQMVVLKALNKLLQDSLNVEVTFVGRIISRRYYKELIRYSKKNGIYDKVKFVYHDNLQSVVREIDNCDIFVNSSRIDTCGTVTQEGMARGKPIIAGDVGFNQEMLGETGLLFNLDDPEDLYNQIKHLVICSDDRIRYGKLALSESRKRTLNDTFNDYFSIIEGDINEKR